jgi:mitochondrial enoyl-[acyl-carrier protein] reductase / trans-2-enoyl-CoA reductase
VTGFGLSYGLARRTSAQVRELYADLVAKVRDGVLRTPVEATYGIDGIKEALVHAQRRGRHGKVLVLPNGKL